MDQSNKKPIISIRDSDIFPIGYVHAENEWQPTERVAVRIIVSDNEGDIALCGTVYELLPGGGVEENESLEQSAVREVLEEVGCRVEIIKEIGVVEEYRDNGKRHQITHCFSARVIGEKGLPQTLQHDERGIKVYWHDLSTALSIMEEQIKSIPFESYNSCFNARIGFAFLKEFQKQNVE